MTLTLINNELSKHMHSKFGYNSKTKKNRNKDQALIELKDHFKTFHCKK